MQALDFTNRTVFVAGGTSGINLGIAEAFAEAGAQLAVLSRSQGRSALGAYISAQAGSGSNQYICAASLYPAADASACLRGEGRRGHAHARAGDRVGH